MYRVIEKGCPDYKSYLSKTVKLIEIIQVLKCGERTYVFGYAHLMVGSERR
jgi:hypothetical protein